MAQTFTYPNAKKVDQVDNYHGTKVADPYRWLENPDADDTRAWVEAQNQLTFGFLDQIPERTKIKERLTKLWNYEKYLPPFKEGGRYFYYKNDGLQNQNVLYVTDTLEGTPRVLLDPNTLSKDGTVALTGLAISDDGKLMAYSLSSSGSDWQEWKVRDVASGKDLDDHLNWSKFSGASWTRDNKGFFYSRYDEPNEKTKLEDANYFQKLYYHRVGTKQAEDVLVYERKDQKEWGFSGSVTEDGRYLIVSVWRGTDPKNLLFYKDLKAKDAKVVELVKDFEASYSFIGNDGAVFYFRTDLQAPRGRVIAIDTTKPERANWKELVAESADTIDGESGVSFVNDQFIVPYLKDARSSIKVFDPRGKLVREVALPGIGTVQGFGGKRKD
ncbi:MAG TPA: S9 family peptidase, partial [Blastocatellia bacterium]|nr:S9 family peptidase [Blastocatellia bacterium]